jgi:hypothetical protein
MAEMKISIRKMKCFIIFLLLLSIFFNCKSQKNHSITKYGFHQFLKLKTTDDYNYVRHIYRNLIYPYSKETELDKEYNSIIKVNIIHKKDGRFIITTDNKIEGFDIEIKRALNKVNNMFLIKDTTEYETEFNIKLDFEPHDVFNKSDYSQIHLLGYKPKRTYKVSQ